MVHNCLFESRGRHKSGTVHWLDPSKLQHILCSGGHRIRISLWALSLTLLAAQNQAVSGVNLLLT